MRAGWSSSRRCWRRRPPSRTTAVGVRGEGGRAQRHGHEMEVDETTRVDFFRRWTTARAARGVGDRGPPRGVAVAGRRTPPSWATRSPWTFSPARDGSRTGLTMRVTPADGTVPSQVSPGLCSRGLRGRHHGGTYCFACRRARVRDGWISRRPFARRSAGATGLQRLPFRSTRTRRQPRRAAPGRHRAPSP